MITVVRTIPVARPLGAVFAYLADFTNSVEWDPATVSCTRVDSGPLLVGARFHYVGRFRGRENAVEYTLEQFEPERRLLFVGRNRSVTATDDLTFTDEDGATTVHYTARLQFHGLARLATPLLTSTFERMGDDVAAKLPEALTRP